MFGLSSKYTTEVVSRGFRRQVIKLQPDKVAKEPPEYREAAEELYKNLNNAKEILNEKATYKKTISTSKKDFISDG